MKAQNVLYKMTDREPIIRLGDLGSIFAKNSNEIRDQTVKTNFPSIEFFTRSFRDSDVIWGVGITVLQLLMERGPMRNFILINGMIDGEMAFLNSLIRAFDSYYSSLDAELTKLRQIISQKMYHLLQVTLCPEAQRMDYDRLIALLNE